MNSRQTHAHPSWPRRGIPVLLAGLLLLVALWCIQAPTSPPAEISRKEPLSTLPSEQPSFSAALSAARHKVQALTASESDLPRNEGVRFFAANPGQDVTARFLDGQVRVESARGGRWQAALRFEGWNPAAPAACVPPTAQGNRVEYHHAGGVTEWFENLQSGLEHGFTVELRPAVAPPGELRMEVALEGCDVRLSGDANSPSPGQALEFVDPATGAAVPRYGELQVWDGLGRALPARMEPTARGLAIVVADAGARYPLTIDPLLVSLEAKLETGIIWSHFGYSVAISGDTALVGAPTEGTAAGRPNGSVYVMERSGTNWSVRTNLAAAAVGPAVYFGNAVALDGDTAVVGAVDDSGPAGPIGLAYIFVRNAGTWRMQAKRWLNETAGAFWSHYSMALSGDTAVVGVWESNVPVGLDLGMVYVFQRSGISWIERPRLTAPDPEPYVQFGRSVALQGDTLFVGSPGASLGPFRGAGVAYVFTRLGGSWSLQARLTAPELTTYDDFGSSISLWADTALIGASQGDIPGMFNNGTAYVFVRNGTNWLRQAKLAASDAAGNDNFGNAVALRGDTALIGAWMDTTPTGMNAGSAYLFTRSGTNWTQAAKLTANDGAALDYFGSSVALSDSTALVSAPADRTPAIPDAGSVYVFRITALTPEIAVEQPAGTDLLDGGPGVSFGSVRVGSNSAPRTFLIRNLGAAPLTIAALNRTGPTADFLVFGLSLPATLPTNGSATFNVVFRPGAGGLRATTLQIVNDDTDEATFDIALTGTGNTPPVIIVPANLTLEATSPAGAAVTFTVSASDAEDGALTPVVSPASGSTFPLGTNTVVAVVNDSGGWSVTNSFLVIVRDTTAPIMTACAADRTLVADGVCHALLPNLTELVRASDAVGVTSVVQSPAAGTLLGLGQHTVVFTAQDAAGNSNWCQSLVTVVDTLPPRVLCPADIRIEVTGTNRVEVGWLFTAADDCGSAIGACQPPANSFFPVGATPVHCSALDGSGNQAACGFVVTVERMNVCPTAVAQVTPRCPPFFFADRVILAPNNAHACVVLDGRQSADAAGEPLSHHWYLDGAALPFATAALATNCLPLGEHQIRLRVSDGRCDTSVVVHVEILRPCAAVEQVIQEIRGADLDPRHQEPFIATLNAACASLDRGNLNSARGQLGAFQNKVRAQLSRDHPALATRWQDAAQAILDALSPCLNP